MTSPLLSTGPQRVNASRWRLETWLKKRSLSSLLTL